MADPVNNTCPNPLNDSNEFLSLMQLALSEDKSQDGLLSGDEFETKDLFFISRDNQRWIIDMAQPQLANAYRRFFNAQAEAVTITATTTGTKAPSAESLAVIQQEACAGLPVGILSEEDWFKNAVSSNGTPSEETLALARRIQAEKPDVYSSLLLLMHARNEAEFASVLKTLSPTDALPVINRFAVKVRLETRMVEYFKSVKIDSMSGSALNEQLKLIEIARKIFPRIDDAAQYFTGRVLLRKSDFSDQSDMPNVDDPNLWRGFISLFYGKPDGDAMAAAKLRSLIDKLDPESEQEPSVPSLAQAAKNYMRGIDSKKAEFLRKAFIAQIAPGKYLTRMRELLKSQDGDTDYYEFFRVFGEYEYLASVIYSSFYSTRVDQPMGMKDLVRFLEATGASPDQMLEHAELYALTAMAPYQINPAEVGSLKSYVNRLQQVLQGRSPNEEGDYFNAGKFHSETAAALAASAEKSGCQEMARIKDVYFYRLTFLAADPDRGNGKATAVALFKKLASSVPSADKIPVFYTRMGLLSGYLGITDHEMNDDFFFRQFNPSPQQPADVWEGFSSARLLTYFWRVLRDSSFDSIRGDLNYVEVFLKKMDVAHYPAAWNQFKDRTIDEDLPQGNLSAVVQAFQDVSGIRFSEKEMAIFEERQKTLDLRTGQRETARQINEQLRVLGDEIDSSVKSLADSSKAIANSGQSLSSEIAASLFKVFFEQHFKGGIGNLSAMMMGIFKDAQEGDTRAFLDAFQATLSLFLEMITDAIKKDPRVEKVMGEYALFQSTLAFLKSREAVNSLQNSGEGFARDLKIHFTRDLEDIRDRLGDRLPVVLRALAKNFELDKPTISSALMLLAELLESRDPWRLIAELVRALSSELIAVAIREAGDASPDVAAAVTLITDLQKYAASPESLKEAALGNLSNSIGGLLQGKILDQNVALVQAGGKVWAHISPQEANAARIFAENLKVLGYATTETDSAAAVKDLYAQFIKDASALTRAFDLTEFALLFQRHEADLWMQLPDLLRVRLGLIADNRLIGLLPPQVKKAIVRLREMLSAAQVIALALNSNLLRNKDWLALIARWSALARSPEDRKALEEGLRNLKSVQARANLGRWLVTKKLVPDLGNESEADIQLRIAEAFGFQNWNDFSKAAEPVFKMASSEIVLDQLGAIAQKSSVIGAVQRRIPLALKIVDLLQSKSPARLAASLERISSILENAAANPNAASSVKAIAEWANSEFQNAGFDLNWDEPKLQKEVAAFFGYPSWDRFRADSLSPFAKNTAQSWKVLFTLARSSAAFAETLSQASRIRFAGKLETSNDIIDLVQCVRAISGALLDVAEKREDGLKAIACLLALVGLVDTDEALSAIAKLEESGGKEAPKLELARLVAKALGFNPDELQTADALFSSSIGAIRQANQFLNHGGNLLELAVAPLNLVNSLHSQMGGFEKILPVLLKGNDEGLPAKIVLIRETAEGLAGHAEALAVITDMNAQKESYETAIAALAYWLWQEELLDDPLAASAAEREKQVLKFFGFRNASELLAAATSFSKNKAPEYLIRIAILTELIPSLGKFQKFDGIIPSGSAEAYPLQAVRFMEQLDQIIGVVADTALKNEETIERLGWLLVGLGILDLGEMEIEPKDKSPETHKKRITAIEKKLFELIGTRPADLKAALEELNGALNRIRPFLQIVLPVAQIAASFFREFRTADAIQFIQAIAEGNQLNLSTTFSLASLKDNGPDLIGARLRKMEPLLEALDVASIRLDSEYSNDPQALALIFSQRLVEVLGKIGITSPEKMAEIQKQFSKLQEDWSDEKYEALMRTLTAEYGDIHKAFAKPGTPVIQTRLRREDGLIDPNLDEIAVAGADLIDGVLTVSKGDFDQAFKNVLVGLQLALKAVPSKTIVLEAQALFKDMKRDLDSFVSYIKSLDIQMVNWSTFREQLANYKSLLLNHLERLRTLFKKIAEEAKVLGIDPATVDKYAKPVDSIASLIQDSFQKIDELIDKSERTLAERMAGVAVTMDFENYKPTAKTPEGRWGQTFNANFDLLLKAGGVYVQNGGGETRHAVSLMVPLRLQLGEGFFGGAEIGIGAQLNVLSLLSAKFWTLGRITRWGDLSLLASGNLFVGEVDPEGDGTRKIKAGARLRLGGQIGVNIAEVANLNVGGAYILQDEIGLRSRDTEGASIWIGLSRRY